MKTITLVFKKKVQTGKDSFGNPICTDEEVPVENCLVGPVSEPYSIKETQAMEQSRLQVRIHLPKTFKGDVGTSTVEYGGKVWRVDSDSVELMPENCPTKWNRYFRGEAIDE